MPMKPMPTMPMPTMRAKSLQDATSCILNISDSLEFFSTMSMYSSRHAMRPIQPAHALVPGA